MCKKLPSDASDYVMEAVPLLTNLLQYHDSKVIHFLFVIIWYYLASFAVAHFPHNLFVWCQVLEYASICLTRIAEAFASHPEKLDELCNHGLVTQAASLISASNSGGGQASLSVSTYTVWVNSFVCSIYLYSKNDICTIFCTGVNPITFHLCERVTSWVQDITSSRH